MERGTWVRAYPYSALLLVTERKSLSPCLECSGMATCCESNRKRNSLFLNSKARYNQPTVMFTYAERIESRVWDIEAFY